VDKWTSGQVDKWTSGQVDKWTSGQVDKWTSGQVDKWTSGEQWTVGDAAYGVPIRTKMLSCNQYIKSRR